MYNIYISHHLNAAGTSTIETEELFFTVPITDATNSVSDPIVKCEMGKASSFEFSIEASHPFYNRFQQLKTLMRVSYDGDDIFRGRVLTIDTNKLNGKRKVHLEGDYVFLSDSYQEGIDDGKRKKTNIYTYLKNLIEEHNDQMDIDGSTYKKFQLGIVPGCPNYDSLTTAAQRISVEDSKFGSSSWQKTQDALSSLTKEYGGYFRTRYQNGVCYLDWLESYFTQNVNSQPIKVTENLIDLNSSTEVNNIFTVLIPIGSSKSKKIYLDDYNEKYHGNNQYITVPQAAEYLVSVGRESELTKGFHKLADYQNAIDNYGIIFKTQDFGDADTKAKLWNTAVNWIRDNYNGGVVSFSATALDLHHIDPQAKQKYLVGEQVSVVYPELSRHTSGSTPLESSTVTVLSAQYNLYNPDKNNYTIGIPNTLLSKSYKSKTKSSKSAGSGNTDNQITDDQIIDSIDSLKTAAETFVISENFNNELYDKLYADDPDKTEAAVKIINAQVHSIYKAHEGELIWIKTDTHKQTSSDIDSVYKATNGTDWKIKKVYNTQIQVTAVDSGSALPSSGTLTWVSGGIHHTTITYGESEKTTDKRMWIYPTEVQVAGKGVGAIYQATNGSKWELVSVLKTEIQLAPLDSSETLPSSGTLTWVSGGNDPSHRSIPYSRTKTNTESVVSNVVTMSLDGMTGKFIANAPLGDESQYTDEQLALYNKYGSSIVIDAAEEIVGITNPLEFVGSTSQVKKYSTILASMGLGAANDSGLFKTFNSNKITDPNAKETTSMNGDYGRVGAVLAGFGINGTGDDDATTIEFNGPEAFMQLFASSDATNPNATPTASCAGDDGSVNGMNLTAGTDGTGHYATAILSGADALMKMLSVENAGSDDPDDVTVEVKGNDDGEVGVGQKSNGHGGLKWTISLNKPVDYWVWEKDPETGQQVEVKKTTAKNVVGSDDFHIPEVPSFKTKLAVMDQAIIGKADIVDLNAVTAFISNLTSDTATIDLISAKNIIGTAVTSSQFTGPLTGSSIKYSYYSQGSMHAAGLFYDAAFITEAGVVTLKFWKSDGSTQEINFNIADTQFYKDAISAAKDTGWNDSISRVISSLPTSTTEQTALNTNWILKIPQSGYGSSDVDYPISVSNLTDYSYGGSTVKVYNVKVGSYIAYRKEVKLQNKGTVNPSASAQTITPDTGYDGIGSITIGAAPADRYETGWGDAYSKVDWPDAQSSSATMTMKAPAATSTSVPDYQSVDYTVSADNDYVYIKQGAFVMAQATNPAYENGWAACYDTFDTTGTDASQTLGYGETANVVVKLTDDSGTVQTRLSRSYTAPTDANLVAGNIKSGVTIFGVTGSFADRYETGWADAYRKVDWPDAQSSSATMTMKAPAATSTSIPDYQSIDYTVSADNDYAYIKQGANIMAQVSNPAYTACYNSFDITGTDDTKTLSYGGSANVTVKQTDKYGTVQTRLQRTYTAPTDANLVAGNIKDGVTIFNITGTYSGGGNYEAGWADAYSKVDWPDAQSSSATMTMKAPAATSTSVPDYQSVDYTVSADNNFAYIKQGAVVMAQVPNLAYDNGWSACYSTFDTTGTDASQTLDYGETANVVVKLTDDSGTVQTRLSRSYTAPVDRYETGWANAYSKVDWPDAQSSSATMTMKAPAATSTSIPDYQSVDYTVSADNYYAYIKQGAVVMAQVSNPAYATCYNSFDTTGTDNTKTLSYGGSANVTVKQTDIHGTVQTRLQRTYTAPTDANLVAGNIKSGVTIFNVTGTYSGGGNYESGWADAYSKVDWPNAQTSSATMTVKAPAATSTSTPNYQTANYTVSADNFYAYIKQGAIVMAQVTNNAYADCYNSFDITGTDNTQTLSYGGSANVTVKQTDRSGTVRTRLQRTYTAPTDANLVAGNIKNNVTIFGVKGTYTGSGSTYYSKRFYCTDVKPVYPGASTYFYYFRLEGDYTFASGSSYDFYRTSWPVS